MKFIEVEMVKDIKITEKKKAYITLLREESKLSYRKIASRCKISKSSVERICKQGMEFKPPKPRTGRPQLLSPREKARFLRKFKCMRARNPNVNVQDIARECELSNVSSRTLSRLLNKSGYKYIRPRRKGVLTAKDKKKRVAHARKTLKNSSESFWIEDVLLYLDAVSFVHKRNPFQDALAPAGKVWRTPGEGLEITAKGSKELGGGNICHFVVGIRFGAGAILVEEYSKMNGKYFSKFIETTLQRVLLDRAEVTGAEKLLFLQDNCPSQNSAMAKEAMENIGAEVVDIPPRSPDLNPIENFFHNVKRKLRQDALAKNITREDFKDFKERIKETIYNYDKDIIDKTINSMHKRLTEVIKNKGCRTKY